MSGQQHTPRHRQTEFSRNGEIELLLSMVNDQEGYDKAIKFVQLQIDENEQSQLSARISTNDTAKILFGINIIFPAIISYFTSNPQPMVSSISSVLNLAVGFLALKSLILGDLESRAEELQENMDALKEAQLSSLKTIAENTGIVLRTQPSQEQLHQRPGGPGDGA